MSDKQNNKETIYALIDSQNLNLSIRDQGWKLDFAKFRRYLKEKYNVTKAFVFLGYVPSNKSLYEQLDNFGYNIIFKPILRGADRKIKGNIDAELVLHAMIEYKNYDKAIIITGDGDFYCLINHLISKNKFSKLLIPNVKKYSGLLKRFGANKIDFMNGLKPKLEYK